MISTPIYFQYEQHPGDVLRDNLAQRLPNFHDEKENFWMWFHPNYAGSQTVAYLNDLWKWVVLIIC
ncbi:MAG TPA: hypothetical protein VFF21_07705 [Flavobacteriaceae bacterium]|nr:hypothetical protein [Flavobacteriaceae bacterium]